MEPEELERSEPAVDEAPARLPRVAIVGRPNVGKSTLLNRLCGSRVAIVEPTAGVTRDRIAVPARLSSAWGDRWVEVIDTGGVGIVDRDDLGPHVEGQVGTALEHAEVVLFVVDVRDGVTPLDRQVAQQLRGKDVPVLLVANKVEGTNLEWDVDDFYKLGVGEGPFAISAQNGVGLLPLHERICELCPDAPEERPTRGRTMKLALVGRRNAGKSTLTNALAREERMIVSEIPGTTRDAVDVLFERDGQAFTVIDTAGVRRRSKVEDAIEFYSDARAKKTVRRADVVILLFDVMQPLASVEKTLAKYAVDHHKPVILAANKWDLVGDRTPEDFHDYLTAQLPSLAFAPIACLSARDDQGVNELLKLAQEIYEQGGNRVTTGELNRVLEKALEARSPSSKGYRVRLKYATQAEVHPPTFVLFVNDRKLIGKDYLRYLNNRIREELPFAEVPVRIVLRDKNSPTEGRRFEENPR